MHYTRSDLPTYILHIHSQSDNIATSSALSRSIRYSSEQLSKFE